MIKVTMYGDRLFAIDEVKKEAKLYSVKDCKKSLKDWEVVELKETKVMNEDFMKKSLQLWINTGSVMMDLQ